MFYELCKLLPLVCADDLAAFAPILAQALPVLKPSVGFHQHTFHHAYDVFTHTAHVVENCPGDLAVRWAALLHDTGKPEAFTLDAQGRGHFKGHAAISARLAEETLLTLRAPTALREQVVWLIEQHMTRLMPDKKTAAPVAGQMGR